MFYIIFKSDVQHMRTAARVCPRMPGSGPSQTRIPKGCRDGEPGRSGRRPWIRQCCALMAGGHQVDIHDAGHAPGSLPPQVLAFKFHGQLIKKAKHL